MAKGRAQRQYPFHGGSITAKEIADRFYISVHAVRQRLTKCGDNAESVVQYYKKRYGGGNGDMRKNTLQDDLGFKEKKQQAVDAIAEALYGTGLAQADPEAVSLLKVDTETGTITPEEAPRPDAVDAAEERFPAPAAEEPLMHMELELQMDSERKSLRLYNAAIDALKQLIDGTTVLESKAGVTASDTLAALEQMRMLEFADLVDWNRIAGS